MSLVLIGANLFKTDFTQLVKENDVIVLFMLFKESVKDDLKVCKSIALMFLLFTVFVTGFG